MRSGSANIQASGFQPPESLRIDGVPSKRWQLSLEYSVDTANLSIPSISPQALSARLGRADAPLLLDVRREAKFAESPRLLAGAQRCAPEDVAANALGDAGYLADLRVAVTPDLSRRMTVLGKPLDYGKLYPLPSESHA